VLTDTPGETSLREKELAHRARLREEALADPRVQSLLEAFPGASLAEVRERAGGEGEADAAGAISERDPEADAAVPARAASEEKST